MRISDRALIDRVKAIIRDVNLAEVAVRLCAVNARSGKSLDLDAMDMVSAHLVGVARLLNGLIEIEVASGPGKVTGTAVIISKDGSRSSWQ